PQRTAYVASLCGTVLLFNMIVAWQPWASRLHLPFFVLAAAFVGSIFEATVSRRLLYYLLVFLLTLGSLPYIFLSVARPLAQSRHFSVQVSSLELPRLERYFFRRRELKESYVDAIQLALDNSCHNVGIYPGGRSIWDYPFWSVMQERWPQESIHFKAVEVSNPSKDILTTGQEFLPCAVFASERPDLTEKLQLNYLGDEIVYWRAIQSDPLQVYLDKPTPKPQ
ncbi:MAG: hypothetical protein WBA10_04455, partial [Elainellaceae cyanobacterium]